MRNGCDIHMVAKMGHLINLWPTYPLDNSKAYDLLSKVFLSFRGIKGIQIELFFVLLRGSVHIVLLYRFLQDLSEIIVGDFCYLTHLASNENRDCS